MRHLLVPRYALRPPLVDDVLGRTHTFPLDAELGLPADRFSPNLMSIAVRLATRVSFLDACELLRWFLRGRAIDGGRRGGEAWLWAAYARVVLDRPRARRGEVLIIHIDSKAVPTATDEERARMQS
jgi:hypothetical protein